MFVGSGLGMTQHCGVGALVCVYPPTRLHTHTCVQELGWPSPQVACRACNLREIGATGPSLADPPG